MKKLHRADLWGWSTFNPDRNIDFHSVFWARPGGNVAIDPLPTTPHDLAHIESLGGVMVIVITNSDHVRGAAELAAATRARILGPRAESDSFPIRCDDFLADGDEIVSGLVALELIGSKTPGELALLLEDTTLITGDLVRAHRGGALDLLPAAKLTDRPAALASLQRLAGLAEVRAVLVGDGWPIFRRGSAALADLLAEQA